MLYAFKECLHHGISTDREIVGVLSLIIWSLIILVSVKYIAVVTRADNQGEGGILALLSLAFPKGTKITGIAAGGMIAVGITGRLSTALRRRHHHAGHFRAFRRPGLLTATDRIKPFIIPLTLGILVGLFALQSKGTGRSGNGLA